MRKSKKLKKKEKVVSCFLTTKNFYNPKRGPAYACFLRYNPYNRKVERTWIRWSVRTWDKYHKKYHIIYNFQAHAGIIIEFRGSSNRNNKKDYFIVKTKGIRRRKNHLKKISREKAFKKIVKQSNTNLNENMNPNANTTTRVNRSTTTMCRHVPAFVRLDVWKRDNGRCVHCGSRQNLEYDHIIPFSKGGASTKKNIQILCLKCNRAKSNKIICMN